MIQPRPNCSAHTVQSYLGTARALSGLQCSSSPALQGTDRALQFGLGVLTRKWHIFLVVKRLNRFTQFKEVFFKMHLIFMEIEIPSCKKKLPWPLWSMCIFDFKYGPIDLCGASGKSGRFSISSIDLDSKNCRIPIHSGSGFAPILFWIN